MAEKRLTDTDELPLVREMLSAAAAETTPNDVRRRALASLGLLVVAPSAAAALTASTAQAASAGGQASSVAGAFSKVLWYQAWYAKAALVVGMGGAGAVAGGFYQSSAQPRAQPALVRGSVSASAGEGVTRSVSVSGAHQPAESVAVPAPSALQVSEPVARRPAARTSLRVDAPRSSATPRPDAAEQVRRAASIRDEIRLLDRARAELAAGRRGAAVGTLDEYLARHPQGELSVEAIAVRRQALRAQ